MFGGFGKFLDKAEELTGQDLDGDGDAGSRDVGDGGGGFDIGGLLHKAEEISGRDFDGDGQQGVPSTEDENCDIRDGLPDPDSLDDGANIPLSTCNGNKKSLFIGINYFGSRAELRGCLNDVKNIKEFVIDKFGFPTDDSHMLTLTDDSSDDRLQPTRKNIERGMKWLVAGAKSGDSLFFHYSGHGGTSKDVAPDTDEADQQDETLVPVDYESAGQIVDDEIYAILVKNLPAGVRLTAIMDCCHSGSVFDLPYTYNVDGSLEVVEHDNRKEAINAAKDAAMKLFKGDKIGALMTGFKAIKLYNSKGGSDNSAHERQIKIRKALADVIQFSGCRDEQTSADAHIGGEATGAMSWAFKSAFESAGQPTYTELLRSIRTLLQEKYTQVPQMSTGHKMDMNSHFIM